jgi:pimeloyl-ACP methyl ester carboxylesterase
MRRFTLPFSFALAVCLLAASGLPSARGQADKQKSERVHFETTDQVELHGTFWPGNNRRKSPCVLLLHKLGGKGSHEEGWDLLGEELAKKGFAVLSFDFRGHGDSSNIGDDFWKYRYNQLLLKTFKTRPGAKQPTQLNVGDFLPGYAPFLVNDISAARGYLERRNDSGDCNIANLILVGAEDGAALGALWMATESRRYRLVPDPPRLPKLNTKAEGRDVVACVWLSMSSWVGPEKARSNYSVLLPVWLQDAAKAQKVPMAFCYGKDDTDGANNAHRWLPSVKTRNEPKETITLAVDGGGKVRGSPLLKVKEDEEKGTLAHQLADGYLGTRIFERYANNEWEKRESEKFPYVWAFGPLPSQRIQAKNYEEKQFQPIPLYRFGLR